MSLRAPRPDYIPLCVAGIDTAIFRVDGNDAAPVIFLAHGLGGAMTNVFAHARKLAEAGYIAVALDQRNHGRRLVDERVNRIWGDGYLPDLFCSLVGTAMDVSLLVDMLPVASGIATDRCGMTGFSLGGYATLQAMRVEPRIAVGVSFVGGCDRKRSAEIRRDRGDYDEAEFARRYTPELDAAVQKFDPVHGAEAFADRPLLLLNGGQDEVVPLELAERFVERARPHYTHPERLDLGVYPDQGHEVTDAMWERGVAWFQRWLPV